MNLKTLSSTNEPVLYTVVFDKRDPLPSIGQPFVTNCYTVLITDDPEAREHPFGWRQTEVVDWKDYGETPRRAARNFKINSHLLFPNAGFTVWMDATHVLVRPLMTLHDFIMSSPIACFPHAIRHTVQQEMEACIAEGADEPMKLREQYAWMIRQGFTDAFGLYSTGVLVRKHGPDVAALNSVWWHVVKSRSFRDQLSFPWALWRTGMVPACLPGFSRSPDCQVGVPHNPNPFFEVTVH